MEFYEIVLMGVALSMDAVAITIADTTTYTNINKKYENLMPVIFGLFQGLMPFIGYISATMIKGYIIKFIPFISAFIFLFLSVKIFIDKIRERKKSKHSDLIKNATQYDLSLSIIIMQGIATSIDAFIVGFTLINSEVNILFAVFLIGVITFLLCKIALYSGKKSGEIFGKYASLIGGEILLILAVKSIISAISSL